MNLIERLRELGFDGNPLGHEAADEIERLRAVVPNVDQIANIISDYYDEDAAGRWRKCAEHIASSLPNGERG